MAPHARLALEAHHPRVAAHDLGAAVGRDLVRVRVRANWLGLGLGLVNPKPKPKPKPKPNPNQAETVVIESSAPPSARGDTSTRLFAIDAAQSLHEASDALGPQAWAWDRAARIGLG